MSTDTGQAFAWTWSAGRMIRLSFEDRLASTLAARDDAFKTGQRTSPPRVMFHPLREDVLFVCCTVQSSVEVGVQMQSGLAIFKFVLGESWTIEAVQFVDPLSQLERNPCWLYTWYWNMNSPPVAINHYGTYALFQGQTRGPAPVPCLLCYNVLTESIHQHAYRYPDRVQCLYNDWHVKSQFNTSSVYDGHMVSIVVRDDGTLEEFDTFIFQHLNLELFPALSTTRHSEVLELPKSSDELSSIMVLFDHNYMVVVQYNSYFIWSFQDGAFCCC